MTTTKAPNAANTTFGKLFTAEMLDHILEMTLNGKAPWQKPWDSAKCGGIISPRNAASGHRYRGGNILALAIMQEMMGYESFGWMTFNQAKKKGYFVRKGEKSSKVVFWSKITGKKKDDESGNEDAGYTGMFARQYSVFNVDQLSDADGNPVDLCRPILDAQQEWADDAYADAIINATGVVIKEGGDKAAYSPNLNLVKMPPKPAFSDSAGYYSTLFHEVTHATMHPSRCNRDGSGHGFGSIGYAKEELVAEIGSWMLALALGVPFNPQHSASYLENWSSLFPTRDEKILALNTAFQKAEQAVSWIEQKAIDAGLIQHQEEGELQEAA